MKEKWKLKANQFSHYKYDRMSIEVVPENLDCSLLTAYMAYTLETCGSAGCVWVRIDITGMDWRVDTPQECSFVEVPNPRCFWSSDEETKDIKGQIIHAL
jgi:hypothetical protein